MGRESYELPRGFVEVGESAKDASTREAEEETGSKVLSSDFLVELNDNTTFSPHMTLVNWGRIDLSRKSSAKQDPNEKILSKLEFFTLGQMKDLMDQGKLYCSYTLGAIAAYLIKKFAQK